MIWNIYPVKKIKSRLPTLIKVGSLHLLLSQLLVLISTVPASAATSANLCFKSGTELDLNQSFNASTREKLTNSEYFGPSGTVAPETLNFISLSSVTSASLSSNNCQIYIGGGSIGSEDLTSSERAAVVAWAQDSGTFLIGACDYSPAFGLGQVCAELRGQSDIANGGVSINSILSYNPLTCGGALTIGTFGGVSSYFTLESGDEILATHNTVNQEPAAITDSLTSPTFLFTADADMYGNAGSTAIGSGPTATTDQAIFVLNSFKFALDSIFGRLTEPQCFTSYNEVADLELNISIADNSLEIGGQTTATVTVENKGTDDATGVVAIINLPSDLAVVNQSGTGVYDTGTNAWTIGNLNNGDAVSIILTLSPSAGGTFDIPAQITQASIADIDSSSNEGFNVDDRDDGITDDDEDTVSLTVTTSPDVLLVKRIISINGSTINPNDNTNLSAVEPDSSSPNDDHPNWPENYLIGAINAGVIKSGDEIEFIIYFLNSGSGPAQDVRVCDRLQTGLSFRYADYSSGSADAQLQLGSDPIVDLTAIRDSNDRAYFALEGTEPSKCNLKADNDNGTFVIDITGLTGAAPLSELPASEGQGTPNNSYGSFRFKTIVNEN